MVSRRWFMMVIVLMAGVISGCNVFWEGASASSQITQPDAPDEGDTSSDDGAIREDGPDVRTGDATPPVDRVFAEVEDVSLEDVLTPQDTVMTDAVQDEGLVPVDLPAPEDVADVADAGSAPDVPLDTAPLLDVVPTVDVVVTPDRGQDTGALDVGFDATSVATDGGDAGSPDAGIDTGPICPSGQTLCGGTCVSTTASADHCGACGMSCPAPVFPNMVRVCQSGRCGAVCAAGFANCDGLMGNGCEVDTRATPQHCGACGRSCSLANATPTCLGGSCYITSCATGFANCDNNEANGCEADTRSNVQHCGGCGRVCVSGQECFGSVCSDLGILYTSRGVPLGSMPEDIYVAFSGAQYQRRLCTGGMRSLGNSQYRCDIAAPLSSAEAGSERVLLSVPSGCGLDTHRECPTDWPTMWSVRWRGQSYNSSSQVLRRGGAMGPAIAFIDIRTCRDFGFPSGCVGFYPPAP